MLRRRWPWALLAVLLAAAAAFLLLTRSRAVDVVEVTRGPIAQSVVATGRLATPARIEISSQVAARIERVLVREGDAVAAGAPLVELRSDEAQAALASAQAALAEARARLAQLAQVQRPVAEQQLEQARAAQRLAEQEALRIRELHARGFVSQARVDEVDRALVQARAGTEAAQAQAGGSRVGGVEEALAASRLRQAQANVEAAGARLDLLVLRAPAPARVLVREAEPGDTAQAGSLEGQIGGGNIHPHAAHHDRHEFPGTQFQAEVIYTLHCFESVKSEVRHYHPRAGFGPAPQRVVTRRMARLPVP